jgi:UDP-3-O-[3-hydroxymyristoyl] N-acetylglucosamine deacetylase
MGSHEGDTVLKQTTLRDRVTLKGIGVHSGAPVQIILHPYEANSGICFLRTGLAGGRERLIDARVTSVSNTDLCTVIGEAGGATVSTVEHLMAALVGMGVDNVLVEIDGPEVPILDGSSAVFADAIEQVGLASHNAARKVVKVLKPVRIENGRCWAELSPRDRGFRMDVEIDFDTPLIGRQRRALELSPGTFRRELSRARTFGFMRDVERLWKMNLALGASLDNTVALGEDRIINPEGLRYPDEFVRHKMLDAVGDLALAGASLQGVYRAYCPGHKLNFLMLQALFADRSAYAIVEEAPRRERAGHAEISLGVPAYAPDMT